MPASTPKYLRYYFAVKTGAGVVDLDLNLEDFVARVNSRSGRQVRQHRQPLRGLHRASASTAGWPTALPEPTMYARFVAGSCRKSRRSYARDEFGQAMRQVMALADEANRYIDERKPWVIAKREGSDAELQAVCTQGLNLFRVLAAALKPVLPAHGRARRSASSTRPVHALGRTSPSRCSTTPSMPSSRC